MNLIEYLEDRNIDYSESGKNVTSNSVNITCFFCQDTSNHLGINLENLYANCWICGRHNLTEIVKEIEDCTWTKAKQIVKEIREGYIESDKSEQPKHDNPITDISLPNTSSTNFTKLHLNYLKKRRYNPRYLINKYNLECCNDIGKYKYRIIVPYYLDNKLMTFSSIDVTGKSDVRYLHQTKEKALRHVNHMLYNIDNCTDIGIIVEGLFDVWRIGDGAIGIGPKNYTKEQIKLINFKKLKKCYIMLDEDAEQKEEQLGNELCQFIPYVERLRLSTGDPDDLTEDKVKKIRKLIF